MRAGLPRDALLVDTAQRHAVKVPVAAMAGELRELGEDLTREVVLVQRQCLLTNLVR